MDMDIDDSSGDDEGQSSGMSVDGGEGARRRRAALGKERKRERAMLGDFVESEDEEERGGRPGLGGQGVNFVSSGETKDTGIRSIKASSTKPSFVKTSFLPKKTPYQSQGKTTKGPATMGGWAGSGYGLKMLEKFGFDRNAGKGLGTEGQGRVEPIQTKLRPQKAGLAYGGFKEGLKEQDQPKRQGGGEDDRSDEEFVTARQILAQRESGWKKSATNRNRKSVKMPTADDIIASIQHAPPPSTHPSKIVDMTGLEARELTSVAKMMTDPLQEGQDQIPELRYNIKVIVKAARQQLESLARELQQQADRKEELIRERRSIEEHLRREEAVLEKERIVYNNVEVILAQVDKVCSPDPSIWKEMFTMVKRLGQEHPSQVKEYEVNDLILAGMRPYYRIALSTWNPITEPAFLQENLSLLKDAIDPGQSDALTSAIIDPFHRADLEIEDQVPHVMTAFEDILYTLWLPRLRSALNNDWQVYEPEIAVQLVQIWSPILPTFIRDQITDQLIMPKLHSAIKIWRPESSAGKDQALHWILPWLGLATLESSLLVGNIRRKLKSRLVAWRPGHPVPELSAWNKVPDLELHDLLLKAILPKLANCLDRLEIDPSHQLLDQLDHVMPWAESLGSRAIQKLFEVEFFPNWLQTLYDWLTDDPDYDQVAQWYAWWKSTLVGRLPKGSDWSHCFDNGFGKGLELMNASIDLGSEGTRAKLVVPQFSRTKTKVPAQVKALPSVLAPTFREIVEHYLNAQALFMHKTDQVDLPTGRPIFLVTRNPKAGAGGGGMKIRLSPQDEVIWRQSSSGKGWTPISLDDLVKRVSK